MKMTGGQALVGQLLREGVTDVFGVPGVQLDWAVDALRQSSERIRFFVPRHEQATSYMADGYARTTGRVGACMVVPGPGLLNAMAGLSTAYACNSRVLCVSGNIHSGAIGKGLGVLHEVNDQANILAAVTKWHGSASAPQQIPGLVREAFTQMCSSRPRPVGIEIAHDVLSASAEVELINPPANADDRIAPDATAIARAAALLASARFPVIYAGGGVLAAQASSALRALAEKLQAPVVMDDNGRGAISDRHPLALNTLGGRAVFPHADVILVAGSRFVDGFLGRPAWPAEGKGYVFLNVDAADWGPPRTCAAAIHADARLGLEALVSEVWVHRPSRAAEMDKVRAWAMQQVNEVPLQAAWIRALRETIPDDGVLLMDLTQVGYLARLAYPVYEPKTFLTPGYQGTLGYSFPTGLGVAAGNPGRKVVSIIGDGGFGWNMQELSTARKYDLGLVTVVFNDQHFGNVRTLQKQQFGHTYGVELLNPKFDRLAESFDIPYARVDSPDALPRALSDAFTQGGPVLIEARVGELPSPWHLLRLQPAFGKPPGLVPPNPLGEPASGTESRP